MYINPQEYSYMAMPWSGAKAIAAEYRSGVRDVKQLTALFDACFRIQREAIEAAGHFIPVVVENVRGAIPWVGRSRWNYGSFHLWGDVPALMPIVRRAQTTKNNGGSWFNVAHNTTSGKGQNPVSRKVPTKLLQHRDGHRSTAHLTNPTEHIRIDEAGIKAKSPGHYTKPGSGPDWFDGGPAAHSSGGPARKAASAMIAKIPLNLARHIARCWKPTGCH